MRRAVVVALALVAIVVPAAAVSGGGQKHWTESADGRWQGRDDFGRVRTDIDAFGNVTLSDDTQRSRVEITPNASGDERPLINLQDGEGARVFAVFSNGRITVGRIDHPLMRIDADGTIHTRPGAIVQDLP